jgi:translocation and assembly module TamB
VSFDRLEVTGDSLTATVDGAVSRDTATLTARGRLSDIALIAPSLAGGVTFDAAISGTQAEATMTAAVAGTEIVISGHRLDAPEIRFTGTGPIDAPRGTMAVTGRFDGRAVEGGGMVSVEGDGRVAVEDLNLAVGGSRATGRVALGSDRVLSGAVSLAVGDLAEWRDLAGVDLAGAFRSDITLSEAAGKAGLSIVARGSDLTVDSVIIGGLVLDATIEDLFATAAAQGRIEASSVRLGDLAVAQVEVTARAGDQATRGAVRATLGDVQIGAGGTVRAEDGRIVVDLESGSGGTVSRIEYEDGQARMTDAVFTVDAGRVTLNGVVGDQLDLRARLDGVPARVAGAVVADLDARGTVSGDLALQGPASSPSATFTLDWQGASVAATRDAGLAAFAVDATGNVRDGVATLKGRAYGQQGFDLAFSGTAPAGSNRPLAITVKGSAPFNLLNPALAVRGGSIDGTLAVDLAVAGPIDDPQVSGSLTTSGARLNDPASGIAITNLGMAARLDGTALTLERLEGETPKGGRISAKGTVALATAEGLPANLTITARKVYIDDNQLLEGTLDADLSVTGALASGPLVAGMVAIARLDITVPDALPGAIAHLEVHHRNAGADVRRQVAALEKTGSARPSLPIRLDLRVDSGNRIFVRGRGLDVVLGGDISVTGTLDDPIVVGSFVQQRGKVDILGRSLTFSRGRLNFAGDLDPTLDFAATTTSSTTTITVYVTGQARDPQFRFASTPELPEDEVVSRFIFDRPVSKLTPLQIAQLSTEIARLGGLTGGPGLLGSLQKSLGLDVLEFTSDSAGSGAAAGKYVSDKVYLGVKQTTSGTSRAVIDLDITRTLKTKGEFGSDGSSKIGIGVEMDY